MWPLILRPIKRAPAERVAWVTSTHRLQRAVLEGVTPQLQWAEQVSPMDP
jgi:hypothetical protein